MGRAQDVLVVKTAVKSLGINPKHAPGRERKGPQQFCVLFIFASSNFCMCEIQLHKGRVLGVRKSAVDERERERERESAYLFSLLFSYLFFFFPSFHIDAQYKGKSNNK